MGKKQNQVNKMLAKKLQKTKVNEIIQELQHFQKVGIPRCFKCKTDFIKDGKSEYTWKPTCGCFKQKGLRLSIG